MLFRPITFDQIGSWTVSGFGLYDLIGEEGREAVMARKRRKLEPRYAVNISVKAWDIAKAGAALTLSVRDRDELQGTIEIGQGTFGWMSARGKKGFKRIPWRRLTEKLDAMQ
jgi:hypothetical protein